MAGLQSGTTAKDLAYVRRRYLAADALREAIAIVANGTLHARDPNIWGDGTTACASDSKHFGAWDQNLDFRAQRVHKSPKNVSDDGLENAPPTRAGNRAQIRPVVGLISLWSQKLDSWRSAMDSNHQFGLPYHAVTMHSETPASLKTHNNFNAHSACRTLRRRRARIPRGVSFVHIRRAAFASTWNDENPSDRRCRRD